MITLLAAHALLTPQYTNEISVGFARSVGKAPPLLITPKSQFNISFYNGTKNPIRILAESCSWGYELVGFELTDPTGHSYMITRILKPWFGNVPDGPLIKPTELLTRKINFGDHTWQGFPAGIGGSTSGWKVRVKLLVEDNRFLKEDGFWTGKLDSPWTAAQVVD